MVEPTVETFRLAAIACGKGGNTKSIVRVLKSMEEHGIQPDVPTYTALFDACSVANCLEDGLAILEQIESKRKREA